MSPERFAFDAMGTRCVLFVVGDPSALPDGARWVAETAARLTRFDETSELSRLNAAAGTWVEVSPTLEACLRAALRAHERSGGLVHAGVLPAMLAIGYTRDFAAGPTATTLPAPVALAPLPELLEVRRGRARVARGAGVDLGGIAKGWMADRLAERLGTNALANLGGDLYARGGGPEGQGWPVGVGDATALLRDQGAATSGTSARRWAEDRHHIVDPRTGLPARTDLTEVSVVADSATEAETLAKTALLLGADAGAAWLAPRAKAWSLS